MWYCKISSQGWNYKPGKNAANNPVTFPRPAFDFFVRDVKTARGEPSDKMEYDSKNDLHNLF
jgi:hypothetical protein